MSMPSILEDARARKGYTQTELAEIADVSQALISRIENEDVNPRASTLRELFHHLEPVPGTVGNRSTTQSSSESDILDQIEQEFGNVEEISSQNESEVEDNGSNEVQRCTECGSDFSSYADPSYCPDCGTEI